MARVLRKVADMNTNVLTVLGGEKGRKGFAKALKCMRCKQQIIQQQSALWKRDFDMR